MESIKRSPTTNHISQCPHFILQFVRTLACLLLENLVLRELMKSNRENKNGCETTETAIPPVGSGDQEAGFHQKQEGSSDTIKVALLNVTMMTITEICYHFLVLFLLAFFSML